MGGRHTNFEDWMNIELLNYKNKMFSVSFFLGHLVYILNLLSSKSEFNILQISYSTSTEKVWQVHSDSKLFNLIEKYKDAHFLLHIQQKWENKIKLGLSY